MSHMHLPDGLFPAWLVALGWLLEIALLYLACHYVVRRGELRRVALLGVATAFVVLAMSMGVAVYHFNLLVLSGVLLGPALGFLTAFSASLLLALFGHGGLTLVGLNGLITGMEPVVGYALFHAVRRHWPQSVRWPAALATVLALAVSTTVMIGAFCIAGIDTGSYQTLEGPDHGSAHESAGGHREQEQAHTLAGRYGLVRLLFIAALLLWPLEAAINAFLLHYVHRVRPNLISGLPNGAPAALG